MNPPRAAIVLPARFNSTRFPGKPLAVVHGKPLIEWVCLRAGQIRHAERVVVATDDERVATAVRGFGGDVIMTSIEHRTGTDRVAQVAREMDHDIIVNLQGDEPVFSPPLVDEMIELCAASDADIVTARHRVASSEDAASPHVVKVVCDATGRALYFSRAVIPYARSGEGGAYRHVGIYVFRRASLLRFTSLPATPLELAENLEQLRALENGMIVRVVDSDEATMGVDIPEDIKGVEKILGAQLD